MELQGCDDEQSAFGASSSHTASTTILSTEPPASTLSLHQLPKSCNSQGTPSRKRAKCVEGFEPSLQAASMTSSTLSIESERIHGKHKFLAPADTPSASAPVVTPLSGSWATNSMQTPAGSLECKFSLPDDFLDDFHKQIDDFHKQIGDVPQIGDLYQMANSSPPGILPTTPAVLRGCAADDRVLQDSQRLLNSTSTFQPTSHSTQDSTQDSLSTSSTVSALSSLPNGALGRGSTSCTQDILTQPQLDINSLIPPPIPPPDAFTSGLATLGQKPPTAKSHLSPGRRRRKRSFDEDPDGETYEMKYYEQHLGVRKYENDIYYYTLVPKEVPYKPCGVFLQQHFDRGFTHFMLTQRRGGVTPRRIEVWLNPVLEQRFFAFQAMLKKKGDSLQELFVYHGSTPDRLRSIMFEGFLVGGKEVTKQNGAVHGKGIYTSLCVDDAIQYSKGGRAVVMCLALPGAHTKEKSLVSDSWSPRNQWRVFRKPEQLLPMCVITY